MISHDPDKTPEVTRELIQTAQKLGMRIVAVVCHSSEQGGSAETKWTGTQFLVIVNDLPRIGEELEGPDGKLFTVQQIMHKLVKHVEDGKTVAMTLLPNIIASPHKKRAVDGAPVVTNNPSRFKQTPATGDDPQAKLPADTYA